MTQLFSPSGLRRLDEIARPGLLCVFDFDGTLSPIVDHPDDARLPPEALHRLRLLARRVPVGILTGRSVADIRPRLGFDPTYLVGNHGLEGVPGREQGSADYARLCAGWRKTILAALGDSLRFDPAIRLEDKKYSLSLHYRQAADPGLAARRLEALFATLVPVPRVIGGKFVFNLLPADMVDKGSALQQLIHVSGAKSVIYVGDDVTDEDVFRLQRRDLLSVRIGKHAGSAAQFFLPLREDILWLLDDLIARLPVPG
jgi:trehalose 6-phosphate phosphatase